MKRIRLTYGLLSLSFLIAGMCIYLFFRDLNNIIFIKWIPVFDFIKPVFVSLAPTISSHTLMYNLPDMFWFLSGILFFRYIWFYKMKEQYIYISCFYLSGTVFELSQLSENVPGTFDYLDLLFMYIGAFVEGLLFNSLIRRRYV